ncbi:hydroxymethylglutaryl-CoA lyase [Stutzerimonas nitrititolerans]|uniref:hydroxymethylglutaryl-CoA lyase n=1 Tax=Stutzerimonas nitrititolerans TaxID=2482751 RepID=UPI00289BF6C3|nr:hydroxymethylglutaryl-CoA lyase [Stutzerimonas nitrititolerans]
MSKRLYIQEVATRDGFQIEPDFVPTADKIALIDRLSQTGLAKIEVTSFTSPKAIPNLRDAEEVMRGIRRVPGVEYTVLVPNVKGCERALACAVDEINLVMSASDTHGLANLRMTPEQSLAQFREIIEVTRGSAVFVNASLSTTFGCPFEGEVPEPRVYELVQRLLEIGVQGITLCDTTGMADPAQVERICREALRRWPDAVFTAHFHNTRGMGLANALAALNAGIDRFDASLGGLGGCPYAPGASGNICTEDLVHMFQRMGLDTGVDLDRLLHCAADLPQLVGHEVPGSVLKAGKADRRYPKPKWMQEAAV